MGGAGTRNGKLGTCLIVGCGYTGTRLARRLLERGGVVALVRSPASAAALVPLGLRVERVDLDHGHVQSAIEGLPPLAAIVYLVPPSEAGRGDLRLQRLLDALGDARPGVLVYLSTTGVYGDSRGTPVDEDTPPAPREERSRRRLDAERRASAWCATCGVRCVLFRVPAIYGPHRLPLDRLRRGEPVLRPEDSGPGNRLHVDDLVEACVLAIEQPVTGVFNLGDGDHRSMGAFLERVAELAGLPAPRRLPLAEAQRELSPGILAFLAESRTVRVDRMRTRLGLELRHGRPDEGIRQSLREMGYPDQDQ
jgi:nucleoside-diphosphate-sugar epimerase